MRETSDFDAFFASTSRRVVGQVFAMTGDLGEAEDAVQEAYARAWQRWSKISTYAEPEAWVRTVAFRISVSSWRKTRNRLAAHRRSDEGESAPGVNPDRLAVIQALRRIAPEQRQVIVLHHLIGLGIEEVAYEVGVSSGTVKSRLARGRRALAPYVTEFGDGEPVAPIRAPGRSLDSTLTGFGREETRDA